MSSKKKEQLLKQQIQTSINSLIGSILNAIDSPVIGSTKKRGGNGSTKNELSFGEVVETISRPVIEQITLQRTVTPSVQTSIDCINAASSLANHQTILAVIERYGPDDAERILKICFRADQQNRNDKNAHELQMVNAITQPAKDKRQDKRQDKMLITVIFLALSAGLSYLSYQSSLHLIAPVTKIINYVENGADALETTDISQIFVTEDANWVQKQVQVVLGHILNTSKFTMKRTLEVSSAVLLIAEQLLKTGGAGVALLVCFLCLIILALYLKFEGLSKLNVGVTGLSVQFDNDTNNDDYYRLRLPDFPPRRSSFAVQEYRPPPQTLLPPSRSPTPSSVQPLLTPSRSRSQSLQLLNAKGGARRKNKK